MLVCTTFKRERIRRIRTECPEPAGILQNEHNYKVYGKTLDQGEHMVATLFRDEGVSLQVYSVGHSN